MKPINIFDKKYECKAKPKRKEEPKRQSAFAMDPRGWKSISKRD